MRLVVLGLAAWCAAAPSLASGQERRRPSKPEVDQGFALGARVAAGLPLGSATGSSGAALSDLFSLALPLQVDVGYRHGPFLGALFASYAPAWEPAKTGCGDPGASCSARSIRIGIEGEYALRPRSAGVSPWIGLGIGWEWARSEQAVSGVTASEVTLSGYEIVDVQAGVDFRAGPVRVGPFALLTVGQYRWRDVTTHDPTTGGTSALSSEVPAKAIHEWLHLGVRAAVDL